MYWRFPIVIFLFSFFLSFTNLKSAFAEPSEFIVAFDDKMLKSLIGSNKAALEEALRPIFPSSRGRNLATQTVTRFKSKVIKRLAKGEQKYLNLIDAKVLTIPEGGSVSDNKNVQYAVQSGLVRYIEPNIKLKAFGDDPDLSKLWGINSSNNVDINADEAWGIRSDSGDAVVAILDTGFDPETEDLQGNVWNNPGETPGNNVDDDKNGYIDDVAGCDFLAYESGKNKSCGTKPFHENDHGTHVAGTIGAKGGNGIGISGVAETTKMVSLGFLGADGSGTLSDMIEAMTYAADVKNDYKKSGGKKGANIKVMNASLGHTDGFLQSEYDAIQALGKADILLVAAAGNGGWDGRGDDNDKAPTYPSSYDLPNLISVAAIGKSGKLTSFSNFGTSSVHIAAPGEGIYSTVLNNKYQNMSGTSMAAPHVAGAAALVMGHKPDMPAWMVKQVLIASVKDGSAVGELSALQGKVLSSGLLDVKEALILSETDLDKPRITGQPLDQKGFLKGKTAITVNVIGAAPLEYKWQKDGTDIEGGQSGTLSFSSLTLADAGSYTCTVSNSHGSVTSNAIELTVSENKTGDLNLDGVINIQDMIVMMTSLGKKGSDLTADLNKDGMVDLKDVSLLLVAMSKK